MDARISTASRPDVVLIESTPRPTATPARVSFGQVIAAGANSLVQGAELAASKLPGSPISAAAVRGGTSSTAMPLVNVDGIAVNSTAEGPSAAGNSGAGSTVSLGGVAVTMGGSGTTGGTADSTSNIDASLQQSAQMNLYYLQIQQEVDAQNRAFTTLSNVLKTEHDSAKAAIENVHS
ncbi:MAG TPA: hypothetical protein VEK07_05150 [Polyangiaceae bacterium]|nr:hypothetical protein [Polyangiaceae bacterium]